MSIAEDEAERVYPTRYWDGTHVKEKFYCDTDDLQEAYLRGREAPPSDVEVEAVAKRLLWRSCKKWDGIESDCVAKDEDDAWNYAGEIPGFQEEYIRQAKEMLEIALRLGVQADCRIGRRTMHHRTAGSHLDGIQRHHKRKGLRWQGADTCSS